MLDLNLFLIFLLEVILCAVLVFGIKIADDRVARAIFKLEIKTEEVVELIKEIRKDLIKLNKILNFIKNFKTSSIRKIFLKAIDIVNVFLLLHPTAGKRTKLRQFLGLKLFKALFLAFRPARECRTI